MFNELQPEGRRLRNYRAVAGSILGHVLLVVAFVLHRPPVIELTPTWLANGSGTQSYHAIYTAGNLDSAPDEPIALSKARKAPVRRPKRSATKPPAEQLRVPADAIAADRNQRAGSALGTVIEGPIEGHEVHVAYPVVFPDPHVIRSELPPDLKGDVIVEVTIDAQGNVTETRIVQAIGHGIDEKIVEALRRWRYQPATLDGVPVASKHDVYFHFPS